MFITFSPHIPIYLFRDHFKYVLWILWTSLKFLKMAISLFLAEYLNYHLSVVVGWLYGFIVRFLTSTYLLLLLSLDFFLFKLMDLFKKKNT